MKKVIFLYKYAVLFRYDTVIFENVVLFKCDILKSDLKVKHVYNS